MTLVLYNDIKMDRYRRPLRRSPMTSTNDTCVETAQQVAALVRVSADLIDLSDTGGA